MIWKCTVLLTQGVRLVGQHDTPSCFPAILKPASLTQQDLELSAVWRRRAILGKTKMQSDQIHVEHLEQTAQEELDLGFLEGLLAPKTRPPSTLDTPTGWSSGALSWCSNVLL